MMISCPQPPPPPLMLPLCPCLEDTSSSSSSSLYSAAFLDIHMLTEMKPDDNKTIAALVPCTSFPYSTTHADHDVDGNRSNCKKLSLDTIICCLEADTTLSGAPSNADLLCLLDRCSKERNYGLVLRLHTYMCNNGFEVHPALGNHLILMFLEAKRISDARHIFDSLQTPDEFSWNSLIVGYVKYGQPKNAILLYNRMQNESHICPSARTFASLFKACAKLKDLEMGHKLHEKVVENGWLKKSLFVGSSLVDMYAKCRSLEKAQEVFDNLPNLDVVSWNALMAGYVNHDRSCEALEYFERMQLEGIIPNAITYVFALKACASVGNMWKGEIIHAEIARRGLLERHVIVGNALVDMYAKCGSLGKAEEVFNHLLVRDVVSWNSLIAGYVNLDQCKEALNCFEVMLHEGASADAITFIHILKACHSMEAIDKVTHIHDEIARNGLLERNIDVGNALVDSYATCGMFAKAQEVFDKLPVRDIVSWNSLIGGYCKHGFFDEAVSCYEWMQQEGISADTVTFFYNLKACRSRGESDFCFLLHSDITKKGLENDNLLASSLIDTYSKCGLLVEARGLFNALSVKDVVSWTALVTGYAQHGYCQQALNDIERMQVEGMNPDAVTFVCCIKSCTNLGNIVRGRELHAEIARKGLERDLLLASMLVDMYAKCGLLFEAEEVFNKLPVRGIIAWNVLISAYVEHNYNEKAITYFDKMQHQGIPPNAAIYVSILKACSYLGALDKGQEIHNDIRARGSLETDLFIRYSLIDMFAKSGFIVKAQELFNELPVRELASWNALLAGYAQHGVAAKVFHVFDEMNSEGIRPSLVTFVSLLNACNHAGMLFKGKMYFEAMVIEYGIVPSLEHYTCMVNLFCRAGQLHEAIGMTKMMPMYPDHVFWRAFLGACQKWGHMELGRITFNHLIEFNEADSVSYIYMSNICADAGML